MTQRWGILLSMFRSDRRGQDLIEYALMVGFVAVTAGAILPGVASSISALFSQVGSVVTTADSTGGDNLKPQQPIEAPAPCEAYRQIEPPYRPTLACGN
jgi:pilus assembly protein Flp/PilA